MEDPSSRPRPRPSGLKTDGPRRPEGYESVKRYSAVEQVVLLTLICFVATFLLADGFRSIFYPPDQGYPAGSEDRYELFEAKAYRGSDLVPRQEQVQRDPDPEWEPVVQGEESQRGADAGDLSTPSVWRYEYPPGSVWQ